LKKYVDERVVAKEREQKRMAETFVKEVEIYAPPYLARVLPPEFILTFNNSMRLNHEYVEIKAYRPTIAKLIIKGASKDLYVSRTEYATYQILAYIRCKRCGDHLYKIILTPEELLAALEDKLQPPNHRCETLNMVQPGSLKILSSEVGE